MAYEYQTIEKKWREFWEKNEVFKTDDPKPGEKKFFALDMFPYPSGSGLHVGHPVGYIASDIVSRVKRMQGYKVLHPMGWDAFGLPAEQHAIKTGKHPAETTVENAAYYKKQMNLVGLSYDWSREFSTTDPGYYHWTQYIFLQLYNAWFDAKQQKARPISELEIPAEVEAEGKAAVAAYRDQQRLVYFDEIFVNWCEELKVVLANEEVKNGRSEQGFDVVRIPKRQCMMRISSFADRLLAGLDGLDWPESILEQQRNWIGRTRGAEIAFAVNDQELEIRVFTSRPETIFGVSYLAISPEYADIDALTTADNKAAVEAYRQQANTKSERERLASKEKTGCFTGSYATNPVTGETVPVWVTDYVLVDYGTGAVMGVPAHDSRDFEFANAFGLDIQQVFDAGDGSSLPMTDHGKMLAFSYADQDFEGLSTGKAKKAIINLFHKTGDGEIQTNYRMRDWVFSRQRYWGDPIPLIHWEDGTTTGVPEADLPVVLPEVKDYQPTEEGDSALAKATDWLNVTDPKTGMKGLRETNTMPQWAGSCWYPLRFMDPHNDKQLVAPEKEAAWNSVDFYIGGAEHAVLHLLYARFWYLAMHDLGVIQTAEPFPRLINQGMLGSYAFRNEGGFPVPVDEVKEQEDGTFVWEKTGETVQKSSAKMSKSLRNVVNPDQIVEDYGADTLRIYLMFMGPIEAARVWDIDSIRGPQRFLRRFWNYVTRRSGNRRAQLHRRSR